MSRDSLRKVALSLEIVQYPLVKNGDFSEQPGQNSILNNRSSKSGEHGSKIMALSLGLSSYFSRQNTIPFIDTKVLVWHLALEVSD